MAKIKVVKEKAPKREKVKGERKPFPKFALVTIAVFAIAVLALLWALPNLPKKPQMHPNASYKGIVELWNVEAFEGGSGSRSSWLTNKSAKFEQKNSGLFVHVTTLTEAEARQKLLDGQTFDMVCFGRGMGDAVKEYLAVLDVPTRNVRDNMLLAGQFDGKQYAVPLYTGAYCLFARSSQLAENELLSKALTQTYTRKIGKNTVELSPLVCGFTAANSPLTALAMSGGAPRPLSAYGLHRFGSVCGHKLCLRRKSKQLSGLFAVFDIRRGTAKLSKFVTVRSCRRRTVHRRTVRRNGTGIELGVRAQRFCRRRNNSQSAANGEVNAEYVIWTIRLSTS